MKKFCFVIASILLLFIFALTSCEKTPATDIAPENTADVADTQLSDKNEAVKINYTIRYYDVIEDRMIEYCDVASFESQAEPIFFIYILSELMQTRIGVNSINITGNDMIVDFSGDSAPLNGTGAYEESCILDSISDTMLSVFDNVERIYFTEDGKDYESGHISVSKDTPYAQRRP